MMMLFFPTVKIRVLGGSEPKTPNQQLENPQWQFLIPPRFVNKVLPNKKFGNPGEPYTSLTIWQVLNPHSVATLCSSLRIGKMDILAAHHHDSHQPTTLPETNSSPLKIGHPKRKLVFQPSIFRCELLVSGRVNSTIHFSGAFAVSFRECNQLRTFKICLANKKIRRSMGFTQGQWDSPSGQRIRVSIR